MSADPSEESGTTSPGAAGILTRTSPRSMSETLERLSTILAEKGMTTFAVIDHSGEAAKVGLELRDTKVVIFGNPQAGTAIMETAPLAAIELPLKILLWNDENETRVSYLSPSVFGRRYGLSEELVSRVAGIEALVAALIEP